MNYDESLREIEIALTASNGPDAFSEFLRLQLRRLYSNTQTNGDVLITDENCGSGMDVEEKLKESTVCQRNKAYVQELISVTIERFYFNEFLNKRPFVFSGPAFEWLDTLFSLSLQEMIIPQLPFHILNDIFQFSPLPEIEKLFYKIESLLDVIIAIVKKFNVDRETALSPFELLLARTSTHEHSVFRGKVVILMNKITINPNFSVSLKGYSQQNNLSEQIIHSQTTLMFLRLKEVIVYPSFGDYRDNCQNAHVLTQDDFLSLAYEFMTFLENSPHTKKHKHRTSESLVDENFVIYPFELDEFSVTVSDERYQLAEVQLSFFVELLVFISITIKKQSEQKFEQLFIDNLQTLHKNMFLFAETLFTKEFAKTIEKHVQQRVNLKELGESEQIEPKKGKTIVYQHDNQYVQRFCSTERSVFSHIEKDILRASQSPLPSNDDANLSSFMFFRNIRLKDIETLKTAFRNINVDSFEEISE